MKRALLAMGLFLAAACADSGERTGGSAQANRARETDVQKGKACAEPAEGCACDGAQPPMPCAPAALPQDGLCYEGTRYCDNGVFSACLNVKTFEPPSEGAASLVDDISSHPRCSSCDVTCYTVVDNLSPDDGPLDPSFAQGVEVHASGAGITLRTSFTGVDPFVPPTLPPGSLLLFVDNGSSASAMHTHQYRSERADIYFLVDHATSMTNPTLALASRFAGGARYLDGTTRCTNGNQALIDNGVAGALQCMIEDVRFGAGLFRDIPFEPYATNTALGAGLREADAKAEIAFAHRAFFSAAPTAISTLGGFESSGNPDVAGSHVPALYSVASGEGLYTGIDRTSVSAGTPCGDGAGYPCFRNDADRIVVLITDAPMHNGPGALDYDYDASDLTMLTGTGPGAITIPGTNDSWSSAFAMSADAGNELAVFLGSTAPLNADIPVELMACGASSDAARDAVFSFEVAGSSANITLSAAGTEFPAVLSLFDGPPSQAELLPSAGDENELFTSSHALGDIRGRSLTIPGDTTHAAAAGDMGADYQGALFGEACGANTMAPDAVYAIDVSAGAPVELEVSADMGGRHAVVALYQDGGGALPRWPATSAPLTASGNDDAFPANVFTLPIAAGNEYISVRGDTSGLEADYNAADLGGSACNPDSAGKDAAFHVRLDAPRTLRFDTEGSSFDTVLSLHDRPPLTNDGSTLTWTAEETHQNLNEDAPTSYAISANGLSQTFLGDTTGMRADVSDTFGCGTEDSCGDAMYRIQITERTTLRLEVSGTGYEPGVLVTRADPSGVSGRYGPIAAGGRHTCAISGGGVYCWGADDQGQLGNGGALGAADSSAAVQVSGLSDVQQVCAGANHSCAVTADGRVHCWGAGAQGRLGNDADVAQLTPVVAEGIGESASLGPAVQVACGDAFSCALLADGRSACWGENLRGQLGDGSTNERRVPVLVSSAERFEQVEAGHRHSCAVRASDNAVFCWGEGAGGKLGDGAVSDNVVPARVGTLTGATHVMAGGGHSCAALSSGRVYCWGQNNVGQLGRGSTGGGTQTTPVVVQNFDGSADFANARGGFAAGGDHTCVATLEGYAMCWGGNGNREIGHNDNDASVTRPIGAEDMLDALSVFGGYDHTCALRASGAIACWGANGDRQLGNGNATTPPEPVATQAGSGGNAVSFGNGSLDASFTQACRSIAQPPEEGCELERHSTGDYFFCGGQDRTWSGSAQSCEEIGMQLVDVDEPGENAFIGDNLADGEQAWIGVKRESSDDWLDVSQQINFENLDGETVWTTSATTRCTRRNWLNQCTREEPNVIGTFVGDALALAGLVGNPAGWTASSVWSSPNEPSTAWGDNCVMINSGGQWSTDQCSAVPEPSRDCGFLGLGCLFGFLGDLIGGILDWIVPWVGDLIRVIFDTIGGAYAAPQFSGGVDHGYVCEEVERTTEVTLDPGEYFITVKGIDDGVTGNACEGDYALTLVDLGTPGGGFLTCDDNGVVETSTSFIERSLSAGDYYLILKGKQPSDEGNYQLSVRDVDAVSTTELACDMSAGAGDPARATITAAPGRYYALVKGDAPLDKGAFTLDVRDAGGAGGGRLGCDATDAGGDPSLSMTLAPGEYYAAIKGLAAGQFGQYQLTLGAAEPMESTFEPPSYEETLQALNDEGIIVATVLACDPSTASCQDAATQATLLAEDTDGVVRQASGASDVPLQVVRAIEQVEAADRVSAELEFAPDLNPGFSPVTVEPIADPSNRCTLPMGSDSFVDCAPGATPAFRVTLVNPLFAPVVILGSALGLYEFTLEVTSERNGVERVEEVPIYVRPAGTPPSGSYSGGRYFQDFDSRGCADPALRPRTDGGVPEGSLPRPSWDVLTFDADVRPNTSVTFFACSAGTLEDLAACDGVSAGDASGEQRVLTVTAGTESGTPCTVATQATDCPGGYCSRYGDICHYLEGASCEEDDDCPGFEADRCREGPSFAELGRTCRIPDDEGISCMQDSDCAPACPLGGCPAPAAGACQLNASGRRACRISSARGNPASALDGANLEPFLRMTIGLTSLGDQSRTPSVFSWQAQYRCRMVE
jgi:alpha-tubulin suppressor-like RCC1 family protein